MPSLTPRQYSPGTCRYKPMHNDIFSIYAGAQVSATRHQVYRQLGLAGGVDSPAAKVSLRRNSLTQRMPAAVRLTRSEQREVISGWKVHALSSSACCLRLWRNSWSSR